MFIPHTLGNPCPMDKIKEICDRHKLYLMKDACDALGARYDGKLVGTFNHQARREVRPKRTAGIPGGRVEKYYCLVPKILRRGELNI